MSQQATVVQIVVRRGLWLTTGVIRLGAGVAIAILVSHVGDSSIGGGSVPAKIGLGLVLCGLAAIMLIGGRIRWQSHCPQSRRPSQTKG